MSEKFPIVLHYLTLALSSGGMQCTILRMPARKTTEAYLTASKRRVLRNSLGKIVVSGGDKNPVVNVYTDDPSQLDAPRQQARERMLEKCEAIAQRANDQLLVAKNPEVTLFQEDYTDHIRFG